MSPNIEPLLDEVRLLWHVMARSAERLHEKEPVTLGMRGVLEFLARTGPAAVPHVARCRRVTRQHIQAQVNALIELGLVALETNPGHKRSSLVCLTPEGERALARMRSREERLLGRLDLGADAREIDRAAETLRSVRRALEGGRP